MLINEEQKRAENALLKTSEEDLLALQASLGASKAVQSKAKTGLDQVSGQFQRDLEKLTRKGTQRVDALQQEVSELAQLMPDLEKLFAKDTKGARKAVADANASLAFMENRSDAQFQRYDARIAAIRQTREKTAEAFHDRVSANKRDVLEKASDAFGLASTVRQMVSDSHDRLCPGLPVNS